MATHAQVPSNLNEELSILGKGWVVPAVRKVDTRIPCVKGIVRAEEGEEGRPSEEEEEGVARTGRGRAAGTSRVANPGGAPLRP